MLKAGDIISGQEATAQININGDIIDLFMAKSAEATMEKEKSDVRTLGNRVKQKKTICWEGKGQLSMYYVSSIFRELAIEYINTGKDFYFTLIITNEDATSTVGAQTVALYNCNLDSTCLAKFDTDAQALDESTNFTFTGAEILKSFNAPATL